MLIASLGSVDIKAPDDANRWFRGLNRFKLNLS